MVTFFSVARPRTSNPMYVRSATPLGLTNQAPVRHSSPAFGSFCDGFGIARWWNLEGRVPPSMVPFSLLCLVFFHHSFTSCKLPVYSP